MTRFARVSVVAVAALILGMVLAAPAFATPTKTTKCSGCHTGPTTAVTLSVVQTAATSTNVTYAITVGNPYGMAGWGVFNGTTKVAGNALASSTFTVPTGVTYTVYGVSGNGAGTEAYNSLTVTPVAVPVAPAAPALNPTYNTAANSVTIGWAAVSGATSYDYQVGTGAVMSTAATSVTLNGLAVGTTAFKLRATNSGGSSVYTSANVVYTLPVVVPAAPVLSATYNTSANSVTIGWSAVNGATSYGYQVGTGTVTTTTATSVTVTGLAVGTTAFKLRAANSAGASAFASANIVYTIPVVAPGTPVLNATYNTGTNSITISWSGVSGASSYGYQVGAGAVITTTATSVTLTGLPLGTTAFKLRAANSAGTSAFASANIVYALTAPAAPVLNATYSTSTNSLTIAWAAVPGATSYNYQAGSGAVLSTSATSVTLNGLALGSTAFKLRATNASGSSAYANATIVYLPPAPAAPVVGSSYPTTNGGVTVSWPAVTGATSYEYQIGSGTVTATTGCSLTVTGLSAGSTAFQVRAVNAGGPSFWASTSLVYTPPAIVPGMPVLAPVYSTPTGEVLVTWPAVPGATSYEYYLAGGPAQTTDINSAHLAGLVHGTSTLFVRAVSSAGTSSYAVASIVTPAAPEIASFSVKTAARRYVTLRGRVSGVSAAGKARIAVFVKLPSGKYRKYVYTVATSAGGTFSRRVRLPRAGHAYAIVTAFGAQAKSKGFTIRK